MNRNERRYALSLELYRLESIVNDLDYIRNQLDGELKCGGYARKIDIAMSKIMDVTEAIHIQIDPTYRKE